MSIQDKPDYKVFASDAKSGEIDTFPDILRGWGVTIDRTGGIPPMEWVNAIGKRTDEWLMYLTQRGVGEWDASLNYPKTAITQFNGVIYVSNRETIGEQPDTSKVAWSTLWVYLSNQNKTTLTSWRYLAKGGEETIKPPYSFSHCLTFLNGLEQYINYSFTIENSMIYFAEPLKKDDLVEVLVNVPASSTRAAGGDIQQQLNELELKVNSLKGRDFISSDEKNIVKSGSDDGVYLSEDEIPKIESIDVETKDN